ncbi:lysine N(6)-hydroxylase/L-ornithine N(5)-oxygenase family protein [Massilia sp. P8910]|uniref:lysine N(6)-hydroxylase/L-ornithine N(5)-oxygenase family protein n=1 Tax=Massilia antarctica TaxID=2765360 RepID=UPI001E56A408|nr:lysine N(6)-hydroxylase/L-ornithine N(5)-oxygenase family protein [Massilia antarctica]MCE3602165.1 lysine N(6)-hydroxylase/L-ornithine N(5)-oxygenase family protein [Massilia antarctica]
MSISAENTIYDLIGVGVGPFNLGLASLLEPVDTLKVKFFEAKERFNWHEGLLLEDCHLQVPFMADLVTMADPTSPYSYLNYLHTQGRLLQFYFYENFQIPRVEYNRYCQWVSEKLSNLAFSHQVVGIEVVDSLFRIVVKNGHTGTQASYLARNIVLGVGTVPNWPRAASDFKNSADCAHSSQYMFVKPELQRKKHITVIGGGQSAAEVFLDLLRDQPQFGYEINWLTRSNGFFPMEYSKLGLEHFSPDYVEHFYGLPDTQRKSILAKQGNWYKGISFSTIKEIYDCLYARSIDQPNRFVLQACSQLEKIVRVDDGFQLQFQHLELQQTFDVKTEALVLGTGYQYVFPACLSDLRPSIEFDAENRPCITRDYMLKTSADIPGTIFVQNGEMHSHGIAAPDLGLGAYRSAVIINKLLGKERYPARTRTVFQNFGIADQWRDSARNA